MRATQGVLAALTLVGLVSCTSRYPPCGGELVSMGTIPMVVGARTPEIALCTEADVSVNEFDAYLTWRIVSSRSPDAGEEPGLARGVGRVPRYYWGGEVVGDGSGGFEGILSRLSALPRGSRVLVFPGLVWRGCGPCWGHYPFNLEALRSSAREAGVCLVFSTMGARWRPRGAEYGENRKPGQ